MRRSSTLILALVMTLLAVVTTGCTSSTWCADCDQATTILGLHYQSSNT